MLTIDSSSFSPRSLWTNPNTIKNLVVLFNHQHLSVIPLLRNCSQCHGKQIPSNCVTQHPLPSSNSPLIRIMSGTPLLAQESVSAELYPKYLSHPRMLLQAGRALAHSNLAHPATAARRSSAASPGCQLPKAGTLGTPGSGSCCPELSNHSRERIPPLQAGMEMLTLHSSPQPVFHTVQMSQLKTSCSQ